MFSGTDFDDDRELNLSIIALSLLPSPGSLNFDSQVLTWRVDNWDSISSSIRSPKFFCGGTEWRLLLYPHGNPAVGQTNTFVSLYLDRSRYNTVNPTTTVCVQFSLVVSNPYDTANHLCYHTSKRMGPGEADWGFAQYCGLADLRDVRPGETASILQSGELDVTIQLRVIHDATGTLWINGAPPSSSTSPRRINPTSQPSNAQSSSAALRQTFKRVPSVERIEASEPLIEYRAAFPAEECTVCREEPLLFPRQPPTTVCSHPSKVCIDCLRRTIKTHVIDRGIVDEVQCPMVGCKETLDYHDMKKWTDKETFTRYDLLLVRRTMGGEDNFVSCQNPACDGGQIHDLGADEPIVTCYQCHAKSCFTHQMPWHEGYTCQEWDERKEKRRENEITTTKDYLSRFTKPCPHCKRPIEKDSGCDHMTCTQCKGEFCWECSAPYEKIRREGNHHHDPQCKHHAAYYGGVTRTLRRHRVWYMPWRHRWA